MKEFTNDFTPSGATTTSQRQALLGHMKQHGRISTIESRECLGISHPAARVMELRRQGFQIETHRIVETDTRGRLHTVAEYRLKGGAV